MGVKVNVAYENCHGFFCVRHLDLHSDFETYSSTLFFLLDFLLLLALHSVSFHPSPKQNEKKGQGQIHRVQHMIGKDVRGKDVKKVRRQATLGGSAICSSFDSTGSASSRATKKKHATIRFLFFVA